MKIIGITGGVGSGKSKVLAYLQEKHNAVICQADHVAWELQRPGQSCYQRIVEIFGNVILSEDETIDRRILGEIVFSDKEKLLQLNQIMHPVVKETICQLIEKNRENTALFVLEAALLLEEKYDEICDELWYIYTDEQIRRRRLVESRNYTQSKIDKIMASQVSESVYRNGCQRIIDNSGSFDDTIRQIEEILA